MIRFLVALVSALTLAAPARATIEIAEVVSPGGITAWLVENHEIPFTALEIRFAGGASLDAPGKRGAINLMTGLLEEGAGPLDAQGFAEAAESLAAEFRFDVGDDLLSISARMLTENRDAAAALLRSALIEPNFDDVALERVRAQVVSIIDADSRDPDAIVSDTFARLAWGDHPYGTSLNGTLESVAALTRDDMFDAKARVMARDRIRVAAVGDITPEALGALLDTLLGDLPDTGAPMPPPAELGLTGGTSVVEYAGPQSVVLFGQVGLSIKDPDYFAAYLIDHILGGGLGSRLMTEVRAERGLTYGISSFLVPRDLSETWQGYFASANEKVAEALAVTKAEWAKIATEGVSDEELAAAKTYLTGAYPLRFDGNGRIASILVGMQHQGLPRDYIATRNDRVEAVTADDIRRVAARLMDADALHFVVVGQPVGLPQ
ncbi:M16 family metallopeptidase [Phaeovulum sp.]|uniref:M16 family metallopeptidase n=1 Tax=Phaeovulum sp. TaxID=2934796 RepID=UPI00356631A2